MRFYWDLFWAYIAQYAKGRLEYRADFLAGLVTDVLYQSVAVIFLLVVFRQVPTLAGWRQEEVFFIYGYFLWPYAFFSTLSGGAWEFTDKYIVRGELDRLLLRPANSLFQLILEGIELEPLMGLVTGSAIMFWSAGALGLDWRWYDPLLMLLLTAGSTLIYLGVYLSLACIGFWYDGRTGLLPLMWNVNTYGRYPISIYNGVLRTILTWVLPFAFVGFYPAAYFLRREAFLGWALATPVMGLAFFSLAVVVWRVGVKRYHGTGS
ncbi:MAG TPA: ABC-2 family transporter protein [Symbiobacteriaceae bacterium]|nr:ABC-2 family transporter protein [Symbiobacteriaceae bacterium]